MKGLVDKENNRIDNLYVGLFHLKPARTKKPDGRMVGLCNP